MEKFKTNQRKKFFFVDTIIHSYRTFIVGLLLAGFSLSAMAQISISGTVTDATGETIPGVNVVLKGTGFGTVTNFDGKYSISVQDTENILAFSFVGYNTIEIQVGDRRVIDVQMRENTMLMEEVVVVGYGTMKKENLTGAVVSVNVDQTLGSRPIADVGRGLQGSVPGLSVVVASGEIGSDAIMKIRGQVGSSQGTANPLILLDNVEIPSIQIVNPDDIESISVLKDAASASIYGARAAFGVILITTKKGAKKESVQVTYSNNFSWQNRAKELEMAQLDAIKYQWFAAVTRNPEALPGSVTFTGNMWRTTEASLGKAIEWQKKWGDTVKPGDPFVFGRDWYYDGGSKVGYRTFNAVETLVANWTPTQTHNFSVNGMSGKTSYNIGLGFLDQSGMVKPAKIDDFRRHNASLKLTSEINEYITVNVGAMYSDRNKRYPSVGSVSGGDPWLYAYRWGPLMPIGCQDQFGRDLRGPYYEFGATTTSNTRNIYSNINLGTLVNITNNWNVKFDYTYVNQQDITNYSIPTFTAMDIWYTPPAWIDDQGNRVWVNDEGEIVAPDTPGGIPAYRFDPVTYPANVAFGTTSSISRESRTTDKNVFDIFSTYNLRLQEVHAFKFIAGFNAVTGKWEEHFARRTELTDFDNPQFPFTQGSIGESDAAKGDAYWDSEVAFFGRVNYAFSDKYLLEANLRYGGSSKFPKHLKWRYFPSFSAGWVVTGESFTDGIQHIMNFAKLRASWGQLGDQTVPNNLYIPRLNSYNTGWQSGSEAVWSSYRSPVMVSSDIKWQTIEVLNLGADLRFLNNRIGVTFDWFKRDTRDMIISGDAIAVTLGASAPQGNYGSLQTKGFELSIDFTNRFSNGLGINGMVTLQDAVSYCTKGPDHKRPWEDRGINSNWSTGARYGDFWGYVTDRLYQYDDFVPDPNSQSGLKKTTIIVDGQAPRDSYMLQGDNPVYQTRLEDGGGVVIFRPGDVKFVDLDGDGYITPGLGTFGDPGDRKVIGNSTPRYEYGFRMGADYKGFDFSFFVQGVGSRQMWGAGQLAIPGYHVADGATPLAIARNCWMDEVRDRNGNLLIEARHNAFYPRPWDNGGENTNYSLQQQTKYVLNMAYTRIKNITFGYSVPERLLKQVYLSKARVYVSLENFFTFDNLRGLPLDPEVVTGYSMFNLTTSNNANLTRTGMGSPVFKSVSVGCQITFK